MELNATLMQKLLDVIDDIVAAEGPYKEKVDSLIKFCGENEKTNLFEFIAWFDGMEL